MLLILPIIIVSSITAISTVSNSYQPLSTQSRSKIPEKQDNFTFNYSMNHIWKANFLSKSFTRIYISDKCPFVYFTTLKTASKTTRELIDIKQCGFGYNIYDNGSYWKSCGNHICNQRDYNKILSSKYYNIIFTRNPIDRFESNYNFLAIRIPMYYRNLIPKNITNDMIEKKLISGKHLDFLRFIQYFEDVVMNKTWKWFGRRRTDHLQPIYLYSCVIDRKLFGNNMYTKCFIPSFVGKVENLMNDIHWLDDNMKLGNNTKVNTSIYSATHKTLRVKIEKGTIYKYKNALLTICKLYWNDFYCGNYDIPFECQTQNVQVWHFPTNCIDGSSDRIISWPIHTI